MRTRRPAVVTLCLLCLVALSGASRAADAPVRPLLHPLFAEHAVVQRDRPIPVWGWCAPGARVTVELNGKTGGAIAGADGRWQATLGPFPAGGPCTLTVRAGERTVTVGDILIGDVWICSGQSNMEMGIGACNVPDELATATHPRLRLLTVPRLVAFYPHDTLACAWAPCSPETVAQGGWGGFSAAGYFFGRDLERELGVPIGLIHTSWGGTIAEAWTSAEALEPLGDFNGNLEYVAKMRMALAEGRQHELLETWFAEKDPGSAGKWFAPDTDTTAEGWRTAEMPKPWEQTELGAYDGIAWFRRDVDLPADWNGRELVLSLGPIDDIDTTWVNGVRVGGTDNWMAPREYAVPAGTARAGRNTIAVRVLDTGGAGGLVGRADQLAIYPKGDRAAAIALNGPWRYRNTAAMNAVGSAPPTAANNPNVCTVLYNGMIAPLLPYAIKGAIWYQGESNAGRAYQYRRLLPAMIGDWRNRFGVGDFPFYIVQLANWQGTNAVPRDNEWAELREAQTMTAQRVPNCGLAVAIDIGEAGDIHPKNKMEVGRRLALNALATAYGKNVEYSGPLYRAMTIEGNTIRLTFDHVGGGLVARDGALKGFAIAGADRKFVWADATIDGETVVVTSAKVTNPVAVRYAWDINPVCNLYNKAGLPAVPFRTDDWPCLTADRK